MISIILMQLLMALGFAAPPAPPPLPPMNDAEKFYHLTRETTRAYAKGNPELAKSSAEKLLIETEKWKEDWNYGNAVHVGHAVLGLVALDNGDLNEAKGCLAKSGATPGSPQLNSFGPNMRLAKRLLEKDETDAVLEYFADCRKFWSFGSGKYLDEWTTDVKEGRSPDFRANLDYYF